MKAIALETCSGRRRGEKKKRNKKEMSFKTFGDNDSKEYL